MAATKSRSMLAGLSALGASVLLATGTWAGGSMGDDDDHDDSRNVIGFVRDLGSGPLSDARVAVGLRGSSSTFVTRTDSVGRYRITGFAADVDPKALAVTCTKDGFAHLRSILRNPNPPPEAPIEADCLMERSK